MSRTFDLTGSDWELREALGLTWQRYLTATAEAPGWLPATVPGSVIAELHTAGEIPDPFVGRNSRAAEWASERSWVYRRTVDVPPSAPGERTVLEFDGIDPGGTVFWDGVDVGRVDGLYHRIRIDLTQLVSGGGRHLLAVVVDPSPASEPQVGRTDRVRVHRPRMNEGWDFCPRLRHQGIWKGVRLVVGAVLLADATAHASLDPALKRGRVDVAAGIEAPPGIPVRVRAELFSAELFGADIFDGLCDPANLVAQGSTAVTGSAEALAASVRLEVDNPRLWWPNGSGESHLYRLRVSVAEGPEAEGSFEDPDEWAVSVGFRTVRFARNPGAPPDALPYTLVANGRPLPAVGWNWVPADALYGAIPAGRVAHLIDLAARSGARLLRVWGGGLIETEEFYRACDEAGLMVWQEFSQSSSGMQSAPATDAGFVEYLRAEAEAIVPPLAHHPSLIAWGGGNELDDNGVPLDDRRSPALAALHDVVARLDPARHWVPTSPTGPEFHNRLDRIRADPLGQHDVHGPWEHQGLEGQHTLYNAGTSLAHTEFGVEGMTNLRCLEALVPEAVRWPADRSNPVYRHLGEWWNNADLVQRVFAGRLDTIERMQRASQLLQATGLQYAIEADRRRAPHCSMVLPWQLNESFPNAWCTSCVDHRGDPKPVFDAVARAFRPQRATIRVDRTAWAGHATARAEAWLWSEQGVAGGGSVVLRLCSVGGETLAEASGTLGPVAEPAAAVRLDVPLTMARANGSSIVLWEVSWRDAAGRLIDRDLALASTTDDLAGLLDLDPARLAVGVEPGDGPDAAVVLVRHLDGPVVVALRIVDARPIEAPGWTVAGGDPRPLMPGEERCYPVLWRGDDGGTRLLRVESWNAEPVILDAPPFDASALNIRH